MYEYERIAEQLRSLIVSGEIRPEHRLPSESDLAEMFGASRATVREALRCVAAEGLITTRKGMTGGSFATSPSAADTSERLRLGLNLLSPSLSLEDFMEIRAFLEVPGSRLAASRRTDEEMASLASTMPGRPVPSSDIEYHESNRDFHFVLIEMCHNPLLRLTAQPMFLVLQTGLDRTRLPHNFHTTVLRHHRAIAVAVQEQECDLAAQLMAEHLEWLTPRYRRVWRGGAHKTP
jgi:DNA-binding FadR family transcriptional regulator